MAEVNRTVTETLLGDLYPDRCLSCYELLAENYGGTKPDKCTQCQNASQGRRGRRHWRLAAS